MIKKQAIGDTSDPPATIFNGQDTIAGRSQDRLRQAAASLRSAKDDLPLRTVVADETDASAIAELFETEKTVDHVFIPAGELRPGTSDLLTADPQSMRAILETRILGVASVVRHAKPRMLRGSIVLMSGLYASHPRQGSAMAAAAVAGVEGLVRALALDLAPLRVNAVAPGTVDTPLWDSFGSQRTAAMEHGAGLPVGRVGRPEEIAEAVLFLMSNEFITGIVLPIDGGGSLI